ncbi:MAG: plasma-membrane proton-efflux P-type ATPase [Candidatus Marsarchaeota archaeon]|jgi:H+-transporting ATPase|nr:plasma-membrane proton-efflux P-type ATPase [Candidatus Marsarchaeota archaeon]
MTVIKSTKDFEKMNVKSTLDSLQTNSSFGLSKQEAAKRLTDYGYNEIPEKKQNPFLIFLSKFYGPVQALLWLVILLSYLLNHMRDFYIVIALLIFNAIVSFIEEYKADKSIDALKQRLSQHARVIRDKVWQMIPARELVPGDIIRIRMGDIVPADAKIINSEGIEVDESIITGESLPINKANNEILYEGSTIKRGEATSVVIGTGLNTFYGKTAKLLEFAKPHSHIEEIIMNIVRYLIYADIIVLIVLFLYGFFYVHTPLVTLIPFLLIIFIASVPVALSAAFTVAMALGTEKLAKKSILITKLEALENTATMTMLCMDKTGTITQNKINVKEVFNAKKHTNNETIEYAAESSRLEDADPIDLSIIEYANSLNITTKKVLLFTPFDPTLKRTYAEIGNATGKFDYAITKGATQIVLEMCKLNAKEKKEAFDKVYEFASKGYRTIAVAISKDKKNWEFVGLIALYDAPRPQAKQLISELKSFGVKPKMLTGDNIAVAKEIGSELGIGNNIIDMNSLNKNNKDYNSLIFNADGFANVFPEDKYDIVKAMQSKKSIIGMTGDGVNDAPALKEADVGIAVANATDVAKSSASLVLTKNGIAVIIDAIKESRRIFERMLTYTLSKVSKVFQIIAFVAIVFIVFKFIPITPFLLVLLIFTNDIINISIATDNTSFSKNPDIWNVGTIIKVSGILGISLIIQALLLIPIGFSLFSMSLAEFQTFAFLMLDITDKFLIFNVRSKNEFWKVKPSNTLLISSFAGILIGVVFAYYGIFITPISIAAIIFIILISTIFFFIDDIIKIITFKHAELHV